MNRTAAQKETNRYRYERSTDGCDHTFEIFAPGRDRPFTGIAFWEAEEWAESLARRIVAALNACEGITTEALEGLTFAKK